jgi:hypothetical protein
MLPEPAAPVSDDALFDHRSSILLCRCAGPQSLPDSSSPPSQQDGTPAALAGQQFRCRRAQIERLDSYHEYSSFDRYPTAANTVHECLTDLLDWVRGGIMGERKPWWPKLKSLPFFTSSAEWEAQLSAEDRIEVEDDEDEKKEENAVGGGADPAIKKSDKP